METITNTKMILLKINPIPLISISDRPNNKPIKPLETSNKKYNPSDKDLI